MIQAFRTELRTKLKEAQGPALLDSALLHPEFSQFGIRLQRSVRRQLRPKCGRARAGLIQTAALLRLL